MTWNYRLVEHHDKLSDETWVEIHEVFYDGLSRPISCTEDGVSVFGADKAECLESFERMKQAFDRPVIKMSYFEALEPLKLDPKDVVPMTPELLDELTKETEKDGK